MNDLALKYLKISGIGFFDLGAGVLVATVMNSAFGVPKITALMTNSQFVFLLADVFLQASLTMWLGEEIRGFFLNPDTIDPTGGILFILAVFRQPYFWKKVDSLTSWVVTHLNTFWDSSSGNQLEEGVNEGGN